MRIKGKKYARSWCTSWHRKTVRLVILSRYPVMTLRIKVSTTNYIEMFRGFYYIDVKTEYLDNMEFREDQYLKVLFPEEAIFLMFTLS